MNDDATKKKSKSWLWPKIDDRAAALELAKAGAFGGGLMLAGMLIALGVVYFSDDAALLGWESLKSFYIGQAIQIAVAAFLTWRIFTGKGRFASIILLIWILAEVALKAAALQLSAGFAIMWFFAILSLVHSVRGSWALRKF